MTLFASLATAGCGSDPGNAPALVQFDACQPLLLAPDGDVQSDQRQGIAGAVAMWNQAAATRLGLSSDAPSPGSASAPLLPIHFQRAAAPFHGLYDDSGVEVFINQDLADHARVVAIAHELGHAFGLVHVPAGERPSLMNSGNITVDATAADVAVLAARWGRCEPASPAAP